jgi:hypothetical protein
VTYLQILYFRVHSTYYSVHRRYRLTRSGGTECLLVANVLNVNFEQISLPLQFDCLAMLDDWNNSTIALPLRTVTAYRPPVSILMSSDQNLLFFSALD